MAVSNDLAGDRRVLRHAAALSEAGCDVSLVARMLPSSSSLSLPWPAVRMRLRYLRGWRFYAEFNRRLACELRRQHPDIVWANDTDTLPGCFAAARRTGAALVFDAHELFPEVPEIQHKPFVKSVWRTIERCLLPRCDARLTVCRSIADYYHRKLGVEMAVVRNLNGATSGLQIDRAAEQHANSPAVHPLLLYQGAVNTGRGVDWAIDALGLLPHARLLVAGVGDLLDSMKAYAASRPWAGRIAFLGHVPPDRLDDLTRKADVGLVMLADMGLSYHYALPNRIGDFVAAGVPVVVSDLPEMSAVVRRFDIGEVIAHSSKPAVALADAVRRVLARGKAGYNFDAARADMDWNREKQILVQIVKNIVNKQNTLT